LRRKRVMAELLKSKKHDEIFIIEIGKKCWIENWLTFVYLAEQNGSAWEQFLAQVEVIPFEQLRDDYPVGLTKVLRTVPSIIEGKKPREIFYPVGNGGHQTDKIYKMLYVCPWYSLQSGFGGLDEIKEIGFNTYHTYSPFQWEQNGYSDTPEGKADCLRQVKDMLVALKARGMYGCLQMPLRDDNLRAMTEVMKDFDNALAGTVEEPDMTIPPNPTLADQRRIYTIIKSIAPNMQVWGCFDGGQWEKTLNTEAYDVIITDSYAYGVAGGAVPGTPAAGNDDYSLPWWKIDPWIFDRKIPMMHKVLPKDMGIINIQQGFYSQPNKSGLPNIEEEWNLYHKEFGLNSFAIYAHGAGQGMDSTWVMDDNRPEPYSLKNQCKQFMAKMGDFRNKKKVR